MEQWYRQNKVFLPWALLGLEVAVSIGQSPCQTSIG